MNNARHLAPKLSARYGFTMIEVMIVMVVIGILAAIVLPAYKNYVLSGRIPLATSGLASEQVQMEQFFQDYQTYVGAPGCTSAGNGSNSAYFQFTCNPAASATGYTLQAKGVAGSAMAGFTYTITQANLKTTVAVPSGWAGTSNTCWVTNKGGAC